MKIILGSDHAGKELREQLKTYLESQGYEIMDCGTKKDKANYVVEGIKVAENLMLKNGDLGIIICGTGIGISIAANKVRGVRAALAVNEEMATLARQHNDANILALGARMITEEEAFKIVDAFLAAEFEGGRHSLRVDTLIDYEDSCIDC